MNPIAKDRLLNYNHAFDHDVSFWIATASVGLLILAAVIVMILLRIGRLSDNARDELLNRIRSWAVLLPLMIGPVLLGGLWAILACGLLSLLCYREYARATGLFREHRVSAMVVLGILLLTIATLDHWYGLFMALAPLTVVVIAAVAILDDQPKGYVQRVSLGVLGFLLFGFGLNHLGYMANGADYRPLILMLLWLVEFNDVSAYCVGKLFGRHKLAPNTSPGKTIEGALGALVLTTALTILIGHFVFSGTRLDTFGHLLTLGVIISLAGQMGDLTLSSIKRDIGIKDMGVTIPGHGGLLDRFDSLILVAPAVFHYVSYFRGIGLDQPVRILTGGS